ncbi:VanZ family protein [Amycolatopsis sp.]|uniref:VanZ family protein n=1 Tax=Amycolatopsis sp. TaxID=37632 RepID=UPI002C246502|nr:VanZ family protein [Amycolatopsis sp.]HVV09187.1 VanZ family protein [Amycolatopsis sp.]
MTTAMYLFPIVALVIMIPVAVVSYRRRGRAGGWATVVFYSFVFYLLAIAMQTIVPLPDGNAYCAGQTYASSPQLQPFNFVEVVAQRAHGHWSPRAMLHNPAIWTTALNVVMLAPLGIFLRYLRNLRLLPTVLIGFGISLFFELTQLTGLWFVYPCPYRLFSVDDLILNTTGVALGWLVGGPLIKALPSLAAERDRRRFAAKVTLTRRLFALITDIAGFTVLLAFMVGLLTLFGADRAHRGAPTLILALVWFVLVPALTGSTLGKRAMLLRVDRVSGRHAGPIALLVRNGILFSPLWLLWLLLHVDRWDIADRPQQLLIPLGMLVSVLVVLVWTPLAVLLDDEHRAPYERLTRTRNVAILREPAETESESGSRRGNAGIGV